MKQKSILWTTLVLVLLFQIGLFFPGAAHAAALCYSGSSYGVARSSGGSYIPPVVYTFVPRPLPIQAFPTLPVSKPVTPSIPAPQPPPPPPDEPAGLNETEKQLLDLVNGARARAGIAPLQACPHLTALARLKSRDMIDLHYFAHTSPTYGSSGEMLRNNGYSFSLAAENIGVGGNVRSIFNAFMGSPGHCSKILDARYTLTGIGIYYQPGRGYLVTQLFVRPR